MRGRCGILVATVVLGVPFGAAALDGLDDFEFWDDVGQHFRFEFLGSMLGAPLEQGARVEVPGKWISPSDLTLVFRIRVLSQNQFGPGLVGYGIHTSHAGVTCPPFGPLMRAFGFPAVAAGWIHGDGVSPGPFPLAISATEWCTPEDTRVNWSFRLDPVLEGDVTKPLFVTVDPNQGAGVEMWLPGSDASVPAPQPIGLLPFIDVCEDSDLDQICSDADPCVSTQNVNPMVDFNGDGVPNECQCGDPNGSGGYESQDLLQFAAHLQRVDTDYTRLGADLPSPFGGKRPG